MGSQLPGQGAHWRNLIALEELENPVLEEWVIQVGIAGRLACLLIALLAILVMKLLLSCCFIAAELPLGEF